MEDPATNQSSASLSSAELGSASEALWFDSLSLANDLVLTPANYNARLTRYANLKLDSLDDFQLYRLSQSGLQELLVQDALEAHAPPWLIKLASRLLQPSCSRKSTRLLLRALRDEVSSAEALIASAMGQNGPSHLLVDSENGSIAEASCQMTAFPPATSSYSIFFWICLRRISQGRTVPVFRIASDSRSALEIAISQGSCEVTTGPQTAVFEVNLAQDTWYNIVLVHGPRRTESLAPALTLYVNAQKISSQIIAWPLRPVRGQQIRAVVGSTGKYPGRYALGKLLVVKQALNSALIDLYHKLGCRYDGNMQDVLSTFVTYEASTEVNVKLEREGPTHPLKLRNSENMPAELIMLSISVRGRISGSAVMVDHHSGSIGMSTKADQIGTKNHVLSVITRSFCHDLYQLGGVSSLLYTIGMSKTPEATLACTKLLLSAIGSSWRNSEAIERLNGYELLARHIKQKPSEHLTNDLLAVILEFIGISSQLITNPLAYRFLVLDLTVWAHANKHVQISLLNQFRIFIMTEDVSSYNCRRLTKMQATKKFLSCFRQGLSCETELIPHYIAALKVLASGTFSTDTIRTLATFIIHALDAPGIGKANDPTHVDDPLLGSLMLTMFRELLCDANHPTRLEKFASTITVRWLFLLMSRPVSQTEAFCLLAHLLVNQGTQYVSRFAVRNNGFEYCHALLVTNRRNLRWSYLLAIAYGSLDFMRSARPDDFVRQDERAVLQNPQGLSLLVSLLESELQAAIASRNIQPSLIDNADNVRSHMLASPHNGDHTSDSLSIELENALVLLRRLHESLDNAVKSLKDTTYPFDLYNALFEVHCKLTGGNSTDQPLNNNDSVSKSSMASPPPTDRNQTQSPLTKAQSPVKPGRPRGLSLRRATSYVLLTRSWSSSSITRATTHLKYGMRVGLSIRPAADLELFRLALDWLTSTVCSFLLDGGMLRGILACLPSNHEEPIAQFETILHQNILQEMYARLSKATCFEPKIWQNALSYFESLYRLTLQGYFIDGSYHLLVQAAQFREHIGKISPEQPLEAEATSALYSGFLRKCLITLLDLLYENEHRDATIMLQGVLFWQEQLFTGPLDSVMVHILFFQLYMALKAKKIDVSRSCDVWRSLLLHQGESLNAAFENDRETSSILDDVKSLLETDSDAFATMILEDAARLDPFFCGTLAKSWEQFATRENKLTTDSLLTRETAREQSAKASSKAKRRAAEVIAEHNTKLRDWYNSLVANEDEKIKCALQDCADQAAATLNLWRSIQIDQTRLGALFHDKDHKAVRILNLTENDLRMRKKLRDVPIISDETAQTEPQRVDATKTVPLVAQTASVNAVPDRTSGDVEDRNRRVSRSLKHGDVILDLLNITRITGLKTIDGLLILGKHNLYLIDDYFVDASGEICNASEQKTFAKRQSILQTLSDQSLPSQKRSHEPHKTQSWSYQSVESISRRQFLLRDIALEFFFTDGQSVLITMENANKRDIIRSKIFARTTHLEEADAFEGSLKSPQGFGSKFMQMFTESTPWERAAAKWARHDLTNFEYLMTLNTLAGRSYNDLTQYPVFPWILADYHSVDLDLTAPASFRDLSKNMGSQTPIRRRAFAERYAAFAEIDDKPFHFGTHYSSAMIVASYMIRLPPFTDSYLLLQGGRFDHADRLFYSIEKAWKSASKQSSTDVRELIPEFFYLPAMFDNTNGYAFGKKQNSESIIDSVELPPWAKGSAELFVEKHRQALESDYVSRHLHQWVDLVFGYKQRGLAALESTNVFHSLSYKGSVDVEKIDDPLQRRAAIGIIHNFGQTPTQLFRGPHIQRQSERPADLGRSLSSFAQILPALTSIDVAVGSFSFRDSPVARGRCSAVHNMQPPVVSQLSSDETGIVATSYAGVPLAIFEQLHTEPILAVAAVGDQLILASNDTTLSVWKLKIGEGSPLTLTCEAYLIGHRAPVQALSVSESMRSIASGAVDGSVFLWDLNRCEPVRRLQCASAVLAIAINHCTGDVAVCTHDKLSVFTINGSMLVTYAGQITDVQTIFFHPGDVIAGTDRYIWTGHALGEFNLWYMSLNTSGWQIEHVKRFQHTHRDRVQADITAISWHEPHLYTGDSLGRVTQWSSRPAYHAS